MDDFRWSDDMSVGVEGLDSDHRMLFDWISMLDDACREGATESVSGTIIAAIGEWSHLHFDREERVMADIGYSDAAGHAEEHRRFWGDLAERQDDLPRLVAYLKRWLVYHIMGSDRGYGEHIALTGATVELPHMTLCDIAVGGVSEVHVELDGVEV